MKTSDDLKTKITWILGHKNFICFTIGVVIVVLLTSSFGPVGLNERAVAAPSSCTASVEYPNPPDSQDTGQCKLWPLCSNVDGKTFSPSSNLKYQVCVVSCSGCSSNGPNVNLVCSIGYVSCPTSVQTGTINVSTNNIAASWVITGPATVSSGSGTSQSYTSQPEGTYTIVWNQVPGYLTPATQSLTLSTGGTISFVGTYVPPSPPSSPTAFSSVTVTVAPSASCNLPWGGSISSGSSATAYQASSVNSPSTCVSETRICNNGTLSGSYTNQNCTVVCSNGAINPTACNQCSNGFAYQNQSCVACGGNPAPTGCTGAGGGQGDPLGSLVCINGATNPINCNSFPPAQPVITSFFASPSTIDQGQSSTLYWDSNNASSCTGTGFLAGGPSGSRSTGIINSAGISTYQLICSGLGGDSLTRFAQVTVLSPSASISASPTRVHIGTPSQITWSASQVVSCTVSGPGLSRTDYAETPTSQSVTISSQSIFTITCQTNGGQTITKSATVNVIPTFNKF